MWGLYLQEKKYFAFDQKVCVQLAGLVNRAATAMGKNHYPTFQCIYERSVVRLFLTHQFPAPRVSTYTQREAWQSPSLQIKLFSKFLYSYFQQSCTLVWGWRNCFWFNCASRGWVICIEYGFTQLCVIFFSEYCVLIVTCKQCAVFFYCV